MPWLSRPISIRSLPPLIGDRSGDFDKVADELLTRDGGEGRGEVCRVDEGKKEGRKTRRRNKMSAALVSCDAAGNVSAGTVLHGQTRCVRDSFPLIGNVCPNSRDG